MTKRYIDKGYVVEVLMEDQLLVGQCGNCYTQNLMSLKDRNAYMKLCEHTSISDEELIAKGMKCCRHPRYEEIVVINLTRCEVLKFTPMITKDPTHSKAKDK